MGVNCEPRLEFYYNLSCSLCVKLSTNMAISRLLLTYNNI